jgi:RNA polymerase sigma factor (sigma-70 family)
MSETANSGAPTGELGRGAGDLSPRTERAAQPFCREDFSEENVTLLYGLVFGLTEDPYAAEEIVEETFLRAFRIPQKTVFDAASKKEKLVEIATRLTRDHLRRAGKVAPPAEGEGTSRSPESFEAETVDPQSRLRTALKALPVKMRAMIELYYFDGENAETIGQRFGIGVTRATRNLRIAENYLEECLREPEAAKIEAEAPGADEAIIAEAYLAAALFTATRAKALVDTLLEKAQGLQEALSTPLF